MNRRQFITRSTMAAAAMALPFNRSLANKSMPGTFTSIRRNVGYFTEQGGTIGWLAADQRFRNHGLPIP
ncbi:MAG: twin-arginine translocation signal domain-containing protein [Balneolaceae bacterium]|nr:twin-arginine translocation signal domain-containing protein [Balneolaceae bacterium]